MRVLSIKRKCCHPGMRGQECLTQSRGGWIFSSVRRRFAFALARTFLFAVVVLNVPFSRMGGSAQAETFVVSSLQDDGPGSFREALHKANANPGSDQIRFSVLDTAVMTIHVLSPLPVITEAVEIDGFRLSSVIRPSMVEIDGSKAGSGVTGLVLHGEGIVIRGLAINRFSGMGILIENSKANAIHGCHIGIPVDGQSKAGNGFSGLVIRDSANIRIGGTEPDQGNVISGNLRDGILIQGAKSTMNLVVGNWIGTDRTGAQAIGNGGCGIRLDDAGGNYIGIAQAPGHNVISGNAISGIQMEGSQARENWILGNLIGTDGTGRIALGNAECGIRVFNGASSNCVGGFSLEERNLVSGNLGHGIEVSGPATQFNRILGNYIGTDSAGLAPIGNALFGVFILDAPDNRIGGDMTGSGNVISGNLGHGIQIEGSLATRNLVAGNIIGLSYDGAQPLKNHWAGLALISANSNQVGGRLIMERNIISANGQEGILLRSPSAQGNIIIGNYVGLNSTGMIGVGNGGIGIYLVNAPSNQIGGGHFEERNVVSGNDDVGIAINEPTAIHNVIQGNFVGTDASGHTAVSNRLSGISLYNTGFCRVGGVNHDEGNVIAGNGDAGLIIQLGAGHHFIGANRIGVDSTGMQALGNRNFGILVVESGDNMIGDANLEAGNLISGNGAFGLAFAGTNSQNSRITGNRIGTDTMGAEPIPNRKGGIRFYNGAHNNLVGGPPPVQANTIAFNQGPGVAVDDSAWGIAIRGNLMAANRGLAIDLAPSGANPNDEADLDGGANQGMNCPILRFAPRLDGSHTAEVILRTRAHFKCQLDFYTSKSIEPLWPHEGLVYAFSIDAETGASGLFNTNIQLSANMVLPLYLAATAIDPDGNTSEFAPMIYCGVASQSPQITASPKNQHLMLGAPLRLLVLAEGLEPLGYQWFFQGIPIPNETNYALSRPAVKLEDAGSYSVMVSNPYGSTRSAEAMISVISGQILNPYTVQSLDLGQSMQVTAEVSASLSTVAYQWRLNGANIPGATNAHFAFRDLKPANGGIYSLAIETPAGVIVSNITEVTVNLPEVVPGDQFQDRLPIEGLAGIIRCHNRNATSETGEPLHAGKSGGKSVWFVWTSPTTGNLTLTTQGSSFDTLLAVYSGESLDQLQAMANNDDDDGLPTSQVRLGVAAGQACQIAVDGFAGARGNLVLGWSIDPTSNLLPRIIQAPVDQLAPLGGEARFTVLAQGEDARYQWHFNGIAVPGATEPVLAISNITSEQAGIYWVEIRSGSQVIRSGRAQLEVYAVIQGTVSEAIESSRDKIHDLYLGSGPGASPNRRLSKLHNVGRMSTSPASGFTLTRWGDNTGSSTQPFEGQDYLQIGGASLWYHLALPVPGVCTISTEGSQFDTLLAVYLETGDLMNPLSTLVASDDNSGADGKTSRLQFLVSRPTSYFVIVDGAHGATGKIQLTIILEGYGKVIQAGLQTSGDFGSVLQVPNGWTFRIETSEDLLQWTAFLSKKAANQLLEFTDPNWDTYNKRFYRVSPLY